jgi:hypothetical protein
MRKLWLCALLMLVGASGALANDLEVLTNADGSVTLTFEGVQDGESLAGLYPGSIAYFSADWVGVNDGSSDAFAAWLSPYDYADVTFDSPVSAVSVWYTSLVDVMVVAYDAHDNVVAFDEASANFDTTGWDPLYVDSNGNAITRVRFFGGAFMTGIDDLTYWVAATFPLTLAPTRCDLFPNASEKVHIEGSFTLDQSTDGINPGAQPVALRLYGPDGSRVYPVGTDKMPVGLEPTSTGWQITAAEKERTGIQEFTITGTSNPMQFAFKLLDTQTNLPESDYSQVSAEITIGNDSGRVQMTLVRASNGLWRLQ